MAEQAEQLDQAVGAARHSQLTSVLTAMVDVMTKVAASETDLLQSLRERVRDFSRSAPESVEEMLHLQEAVRAIVDALGETNGADVEPGLGRSIQDAKVALDRVSPRANVLAQAGAVRELMHAATDAVLVAMGAEPRAATAVSQETKEDALAVRDFSDAVQQAEARVSQMSQAGWPDNIGLAANTLDALAAALSKLDARVELRAQIDELGFQSKRLLRTREMGFTRGDWAKRGLFAALFGLEHGVPIDTRQRLAPWLESAREAIAKIDSWGSLGFQRARTQDAFRCVVVAFKFAAG